MAAAGSTALSVAILVANNTAANKQFWSLLVCIENSVKAHHLVKLADFSASGTDKIRGELSWVQLTLFVAFGVPDHYSPPSIPGERQPER